MFTGFNDSSTRTPWRKSSTWSWYDYDNSGSASTMVASMDPTTSTIVSTAQVTIPPSPYTSDIVIVLSVVIALVIFVTVAGNLLVVVAFLATPKLRTYNNYFILGLAIGDLLVGAVDMPLFAIVIIMGRWPFDGIFCDVFTYIDHLFSHISILLVTLISLDRCIAVTYPIRHRQRWRRRSRAMLIIAVSYIVPVVIWLPMTALWQVVHGLNQRPIPEDVCEPLYITSVVASVAAPVMFFFIPFTITSILCIRIYVVIKSFHRDRQKRKLKFINSQTQNSSSTMSAKAESDFETRGSTASVSISSISATIDVGQEVNSETKDKKEVHKAVGSSKTNDSRDGNRMKKEKISKESMKGVRTLVFIVTVMWIAWFPSVLVVITSSICSTCLPGFMYSLVIFWGYTNSLMNPICYALADEAFKDSFIRIISLRCLKKDTNLPRATPNVNGGRK